MVSEMPSSARNLADPGSRFTRVKVSQVRPAAATTAERMPSFASASVSPLQRQRGDEQGHGEADPGYHPGARHRAPADRGPHPAVAELGDQPCAPSRAERLADQVADDDAERQRRGVRLGQELAVSPMAALASANSGTMR